MIEAPAIIIPKPPDLIRPGDPRFKVPPLASFGLTGMSGFGASESADVDPYTTGAVLFDGTNDYMTRGANFTGLADGSKGIISFWTKFNGGDGATQYVYSHSGALVRVERDTSNKLHLYGYNSTGANLRIHAVSTTALTVSSGWVHCLFAFDCSSTGVSHFYLNGVSDLDGGASSVASSISDIDFAPSGNNHGIGANPNGTNKLNANLADFYFAPAQYLDVSVGANLAKFISGGKPVDLGADGSTPTGTAPIGFFKHVTGAAATDFATNLGSGGNMSITGTLTESADSPSD